MAKSQILEYEINLTDKTLVDLLNTELDAGGGSTVNPHAPSILVFFGHRNGILAAPCNLGPPVAGACVSAAILDPSFSGASVPVLEYGDAMTSPSLTSQWFFKGGESNFPRNVSTFTRKSGGIFGIPLLFGQTTKFYWSGRFVYVPLNTVVIDPDDDTVIPSPAAIPKTYFMMGWENPVGGEGGSISPPRLARHASGAAEGWGAVDRNPSAGGSTQLINTYEFQPGGVTDSPVDVWERLYVTVRRLPAVEHGFWRGDGWPSALNQWRVDLLPSGQLAVYNIDFTDGPNLIGTSTVPLVVGKRTKLDVIANWSPDATPAGRIRLYIAGVKMVDQTVTKGVGAVGPLKQQLSGLREGGIGPDPLFAVDYDYWHCKTTPQILGAESLTSIDWLNGSRTMLVRAKKEASDFSGWTTPGWRRVTQRPEGGNTSDYVVSTTALAVASYDTDAPERLADIRAALGIGSIVFGLENHRGSTSGRLGYNLNAGGDVYTVITQSAGPAVFWNVILYEGALGTLPEDLTSLQIKHEKGE